MNNYTLVPLVAQAPVLGFLGSRLMAAPVSVPTWPPQAVPTDDLGDPNHLRMAQVSPKQTPNQPPRPPGDAPWAGVSPGVPPGGIPGGPGPPGDPGTRLLIFLLCVGIFRAPCGLCGRPSGSTWPSVNPSTCQTSVIVEGSQVTFR